MYRMLKYINCYKTTEGGIIDMYMCEKNFGMTKKSVI